MIRALALALINAAARCAERVVMAWPNTTNSCCDDRSPHAHIQIGDD